ncbi:hypothetical protein AA0112_g8915 [Alternaria arborescens]|uniref:hypothetical protein n=1 Tax=Alternaria arborescens TaxID=156630 RepID=UPI0010758A4C|nr:hypothetical protein AA0111_g11069 [Alternaria arborescens]RYN24483.1 hypothetical protein AA0112_g8915 [Alternaria arborescens]RYO17548.1 hypothetical protein AA0111_g11069 [Alternaria arborescens]
MRMLTPINLYQHVPTLPPELTVPEVGAADPSDNETIDVADFVSVTNTDEIAVTEEVLSVSPKDTIPMDVRSKSLAHVSSPVLLSLPSELHVYNELPLSPPPLDISDQALVQTPICVVVTICVTPIEETEHLGLPYASV